MSQYLILNHIKIQNANSIAGFTWGFPAITHFLGFTHALSRRFSSKFAGDYDSEFTGCMVIAHHTHNKVYQPNKKYTDFEFLQSKNPPVLAKHKSASPPIIEEGKLNLTVSLVIEISKPLVLTTERLISFQNKVDAFVRTMRIAGGSILDIGQVTLVSANTEVEHQKLLNKVKRMCLPGYVLKDRKEYLEQHFGALKAAFENQNIDYLLKAWLDFAARKYVAKPVFIDEQTTLNEQTNAIWQYQPKHFSGYLVPLMTGYKAISEVYKPGQVDKVRDLTVPACFVEAVHSVGEWLSVHRIQTLDSLIWRYYQYGEWYLCQQSPEISYLHSDIDSTSSNSQVSLDEQLFNLF